MRVTNWRRKIIVAIVAGGAFVPRMSYAVNIPLGDPSFESFAVPTYVQGPPSSGGFAYADTYRVGQNASNWVDDLDNPVSAAGYARFQDDADSNWLYSTAYGEDGPPYRGTPRTGSQAMHGFGFYNAQKVTTTFVAEKYYTFSVWAQGDVDAIAGDDEIDLYLFNGSVPFSDPNALARKAFHSVGPGNSFANRVGGSMATQSQMNWTKISVNHVVFPGDAAIGQQIGVGFYAQSDVAVDDASLEVDDASNHVMILEINTTNGQVRIRNQTPAAVKIDYYDIQSASGALNSVAWNSLQEQDLAGFPAGNGSGNGWEQAGGSSSTGLGESYLTGNSSVANNSNVGLGATFNVGGTHDLVFRYGEVLLQNPTGDYNNNGVVDGADYALWRKNLNQPVLLPNDLTPGSVVDADYNVWRQHFGETANTPPSTKFRGLVRYVTLFTGAALDGGSAVPEPTSIILVGIGLAGGLGVRKKRQ